MPLVADRLEEWLDLDKCPKSTKIAALFHPRHTQQEIADAVGIAPMTVNDRIKSYTDLDKCPKPYKIAALFEDDFKAPLYNVWRFTKSSNLVQFPQMWCMVAAWHSSHKHHDTRHRLRSLDAKVSRHDARAPHPLHL